MVNPSVLTDAGHLFGTVYAINNETTGIDLRTKNAGVPVQQRSFQFSL